MGKYKELLIIKATISLVMPYCRQVITTLTNYWPYLLFISFVIAYNWIFLGQGYSAPMDEGYLQSLATRILDGQLPYRDFFFLRTPASIYIQALLMGLLGKAYTLYTARIFLVVEMTSLVILLSLCYKQFVLRIILFLLLTTSYTVVTLLLNFPWYSYDAVFFATISVVLMHKKQYYLAGGAIFLSAMSKQNYVLLLPFLLVIFVFSLSEIAKSSGSRKNLIRKVLAGFVVPSFIYLGYLLVTSSAIVFFENVLLLPPKVSNVTWQFSLFQDNVPAFETALPVIVGLALIVIGVRRFIWLAPLGVIILFAFSDRIVGSASQFVYTIVFVNYAAILLWLILQRSKEDVPPSLPPTGLLPMFLSGLAIMYLSGFNYGGLLFAGMGAGVVLPFSYVILEKTLQRVRNYWLAPALLLIVLGLSLSQKYKFVYHEGLRPDLSESFDTPMLNHITSTAKNVFHVRSMIAAVELHSQEGDYIFVYPDYPALYYLTNRRNPTPIQWYYKLEFNNEMFAEAMDSLESNRPKLILISSDPIPQRLIAITSNCYSELAPVVGLRAYVLTCD